MKMRSNSQLIKNLKTDKFIEISYELTLQRKKDGYKISLLCIVVNDKVRVFQN